MKKVLSMFLAALMILSCMSVSAFAASSPFFNDSTTPTADPKKANPTNQVVFKFNLNNGTSKVGQYVYDTTTGNANWTPAEDVPQSYYVVPVGDVLGGKFKEGSTVDLPSVIPPKGWDFRGWQLENAMGGTSDRSLYAAGYNSYKIPTGAAGQVLEFTAQYEVGEPEEDTFAKVFSILTKIFGTIIGLIAYNGNIEKGQQFMEKIFSSIA